MASDAGVARPLPADAAPPEYQVFRYLGYEPSHMDVTIDIYHSGLSEFLFERLCMLSHNNELIPGAARDWEVSDDGKTWTKKILLDEDGGAYSSLVMVDDKTLGILYESSRADMIFQTIQLQEFGL